MATEFYAIGEQNLDDVFELLTDYPRLTIGSQTNFFGPDRLDLAARYVRNVGPKAAEVGMLQYIPAKGGYTEVINEGGEIIEIYYPPIPAVEQDLSQVFAKKGSVAAYYNHPMASPPILSEREVHKSSIVAAGSSGNITSTQLFTFDAFGALINTGHTLTSFNVLSSSLLSGGIYSALVTSNPVRRLSNLTTYRKIFTVGLQTTTAYSGGYGSSEARLRLAIATQSSAGYASNAAASPHGNKNLAVFDVVLRHSVSAQETGQ